MAILHSLLTPWQSSGRVSSSLVATWRAAKERCRNSPPLA